MPPLFYFRMPRHPLLRLLLGIVGVLLMLAFSIVGIVLFASIALIWSARLAWLRWRGTQPSGEVFGAPPRSSASAARGADDSVIEGDYVVLDSPSREGSPVDVQRIP
ncbi:MAG: hypothetical protein BWZ07_00092 [Alphaproteobacteria bacterium ADurb.BinA280]|jgi:hypothetical protein|nr:hypothetical protein [Xanthomonadales bacterium]OPZ14087.1 MAG: hypothetical protein BWZ07_00092 [Alphaproteobacteria bacterium ADurb.BinA280]